MTDVKTWENLLIGIRTHSGQTVTPERAKRCAAVLTCIRGISEDLAALPLRLYKRGPNGDEEALDHPLYRLLNVSPNGIHTPMELREHMLVNMMVHGGFFNLINGDPDNAGVIGSIWPLEANYVTRLDRQLAWTFSDPVTGVVGGFTPETSWRGTIMSANGIDGVALTLLAREAIGLCLAAEEQGARLFSHGIQSDFALTTDGEIDDEMIAEIRESLQARHGGSMNAWKPMLLSGGLKPTKLGLTAVESQYIEARKYQTEDIFRTFRYPEVLGGSSGKASTYAASEQFFQSYTKHTLGPWATRIEQTGNRDLLTTKEQSKYYFRHDFSPLLRADLAARYAGYASAISAGWFAPAEARRAEGKPFVPGLDYYTRPLNSAATAGADAQQIKPTDEPE